MKSINSTLLAFLNSQTEYLVAEFYTLTLLGGTVLAWSSADCSLTYNIPAQSVAGGTVYNPIGGMRVMRDRMRTVVGTQVDEMNVTLFPDTTDTINGTPVPYAVLNGALDGAWMSVDRAFLTSWSSAGILGTVNVFAGRVADAVMGRTAVKLTLKSPLELLNLNMPRNVYQPGCIHSLYDSGCTLSAAAFGVGGIVGSGPLATNINSNLTTQPNAYFTLGYITFTSGVLNGQSRGVSNSNPVSGGIAFSYPFPQPPAPGDTFTIYPGCDHQQATCNSKFSNLVHFRGMPYVPQPETAA